MPTLTREQIRRAERPTWFNRFHRYPWSIVGHIAQGAVAGLLAGTIIGAPIAAIWYWGFRDYQALSFQRKINTTGRGDTAGLDAFDFIVGFVPTAVLSLAGSAWRLGVL